MRCVPLLILIVLLGSGCGPAVGDGNGSSGSNLPPMADSPSRVVRTFFQRLADGDTDGARALRVLDQRELPIAPDAMPGGTPIIVGESINGDRATVTVQSGGEKHTIVCHSEDGEWRVSYPSD